MLIFFATVIDSSNQEGLAILQASVMQDDGTLVQSGSPGEFLALTVTTVPRMEVYKVSGLQSMWLEIHRDFIRIRKGSKDSFGGRSQRSLRENGYAE